MMSLQLNQVFEEENAMTRPLYQELATLLDARATCHGRADATGDDDEQVIHWVDIAITHTDAIESIVAAGPSGAGIDSGTMIDLDVSTPEKLVFGVCYHHMDEYGYYDGWTDHTITVRPSLQFGIDIKISGRNRNDIKDYLHDVFRTWLKSEV